MKIHILGICGTFMGGLAKILTECEHDVSGSDQNFYEPMSSQLETLKIKLIKGYEKLPDADLYVIGNALSRGNPSVERILEESLDYISGPEMLGKIIKSKKVIAVSGTHGKTTVSAMTASILQSKYGDVGYLIGGVLGDGSWSAKLGSNEYFIVEADEYDSAFFDKRSKFIHYFPNILAINNIEFDHADIFDDLTPILKQFSHLLRTIPANGQVVFHENDQTTKHLVDKENWFDVYSIGNDKQFYYDEAKNLFIFNGKEYDLDELPFFGEHNYKNALMAMCLAYLCDVPYEESFQALKNYSGVKRRLEVIFQGNTHLVYDDFAHHPTAIEAVSEAIKSKYASKMIGIIELASNTMKSGRHGNALIDSTKNFDKIYFLDHENTLNDANSFSSLEKIIDDLKKVICDYETIIIMTNKDSQIISREIIKLCN